MNSIRSKMIMMALAAVLLSSAFAQTAANLTIVSGNGQVVCPNCVQAAQFFYQPLVVRATDNFGNPVANATVNWAITFGVLPPGMPQSFGVLTQSGGSTYAAVTDSNGIATTNFQLTSTPPGNSLTPVSQAAIVATSGNGSATFFLSQGQQDAFNTGQPPVNSNVLGGTLFNSQQFSGQLGTTATTPIKIGVFGEGGQGIPNVAVFLVDAQTSGSTIECAPSATSAGNSAGSNIVLTDSTGAATCFPVFGGSPGTGLFWVDVGGSQSGDITQPAYAYLTFPINPFLPATGNGGGFKFTVTPGSPGSVTLVSGNNQSANPGQAVAQPLVVQVLNGSNQPLAGVSVNWSVNPANAATLSGGSATTTGSNGQASNTVTLSSNATGNINVTATPSGGTSGVSFTITTVPLVTITSFSIVSGNNQSAIIGSAFSQPLVVQVNSNAGPAAGVTVRFQVQSGPVFLSTSSAVTNTNGQASANVTAGSSPGSASVLASISSSSGASSQTFSLTVLPQGPSITASNFYNGADLQPNSLSPCGLGTLIGSGSLGVSDVSPTFPGLPAPQNHVSITFNSISAPILNIGGTALGQQQIQFQVPCNVSPASSVPVVVTINGATSNVNLNVQAAAPGIFQTLQSDNVVRAVIVRPDGSFATPTNPARRGETEIAYVTGLGATSPPLSTGSLPVPGGTPATVLGTVVPGMAGGGLPLVYAQASPDIAGVYLVAFQIPTTESTGDVNFSIGLIPQGGTAPVYTALSKVPVQ